MRNENRALLRRPSRSICRQGQATKVQPYSLDGVTQCLPTSATRLRSDGKAARTRATVLHSPLRLPHHGIRRYSGPAHPAWMGGSGRIAQRESARFTRGRSLVRSQVRPLESPWKMALLFDAVRGRNPLKGHCGHLWPVQARSTRSRRGQSVRSRSLVFGKERERPWKTTTIGRPPLP
jgi:hypothetical protein